MAYQLVYTSAPKLLDAGRSGFGTVARSKSISSLVVSTIERASQFANLRGLDRSRVIYVHRRVTTGSNRVHVLTRIIDAGVDYTGRTNHIAHHLVVSDAEAKKAALRGVTPADILRQYPWLDRWEGSARFLDDSEDIPLDIFRPDGKNSRGNYWCSITGNSNHAKLLAWNAAPKTGVLIVPMDANPLSIMAEALAEFGDQSWSRSFSTSLETTDELSDLDWIISTNKAYTEIQSRCGSRNVWDLNHPTSLPTPPSTTPARQQLPHKSVEPSRPYIAEPNPIYAPPSELDAYDFPKQSLESAETENQSRRSIRKAKKQNKNLQALALCVAMLAALVIASMFYLPMKSGQSSNSPKPKQVTSEEDKVINELKEKGLRKDKAEEMVNKLGAEQAEKFVPYIENFISRVFKGNDFDEFKKLHSNKETNSNNPIWLNELIDANNSIYEFVHNENSSKVNLLEDLKKIDVIASKLDQVIEHIELSGAKSIYLNGFDNKMVEFSLVKVLQNDDEFIKATLNEAYEFQKNNADNRRKIYDYDFAALAKKAGQNRREGEILAIVRNLKAPQSSGTQVDPNVTTKPTAITKEENKNQEKEKIDTTGLKKWQITLIKDASEIQEVVIPILQCMLKKNTNQITPDGNLEINIDGKSYSEFYKVPEDSFYYDNVSKPNLKFNKNGHIELISRNKINTIYVALITENKSEFRHYLLYDNFNAAKKDKVIFNKELEVIINEENVDSIVLDGEAGEILKQIGSRNDIKLYFGSVDHNNFSLVNFKFNPNNGKWIIKRQPLSMPEIVIEDDSTRKLKEILINMKKESDVEKYEELRKVVIRELRIIFGKRYLEKNVPSALNDDTEALKSELKKLGKESAATKSDELIEQIGEIMAHKYFDNLMKSDEKKDFTASWTKLCDSKETNTDSMYKSINKFLERAKPPKARESYKDYFCKKYSHLKVKLSQTTLLTAKLKK